MNIGRREGISSAHFQFVLAKYRNMMYNIICNYIIQQKTTMYCKYTDTTDTGGKEMGNEIANQGKILLYNDEGEEAIC